MRPGIGWSVLLLLFIGIAAAEGLIRHGPDLYIERVEIHASGDYGFRYHLGAWGALRSKSTLGWIPVRHEGHQIDTEPVWVRDLDYLLAFGEKLSLAHHHQSFWLLDGSEDYLFKARTALLWRFGSDAQAAVYFDHLFHYRLSKAWLQEPVYGIQLRYAFR